MCISHPCFQTFCFTCKHSPGASWTRVPRPLWLTNGTAVSMLQPWWRTSAIDNPGIMEKHDCQIWLSAKPWGSGQMCAHRRVLVKGMPVKRLTNQPTHSSNRLAHTSLPDAPLTQAPDHLVTHHGSFSRAYAAAANQMEPDRSHDCNHIL